MKNREYYLNTKENRYRFFEEGYKECPFDYGCIRDEFKYIRLTKDKYIEYKNIKYKKVKIPTFKHCYRQAP